MASETQVQELVHRLEEGRWKKWLILATIVSVVIYISYAWLYKDNGFKGLAHPRAMEQATIARELARGNGFSTKVIRPAELWLFQHNQKDAALGGETVPDTYHAPLWPALMAPVVNLAKSTWEMTLKDIIYLSDKLIVSAALIFFLLSVVVNYFLAARLFDPRLALMGSCMLLATERFWLFSMSGLPQMLMLFLFSSAMLVLVLMVEARQRTVARELHAAILARREGSLLPERSVLGEEGDDDDDEATALAPPPAPERRPWFFDFAAPALLGLLFGLLALSHAITIWIFAALLIFCFIYFRPRWRVPVIMLGVFLLCYTPWLVRNAQVSGNPFGVSWYGGLYQIRGTETAIMRSMTPPLEGVSPSMFRAKVQNQIARQMGEMPDMFGNVMVALAFFIALLHPFKRPVVAHLRWALLLLWVVALFGMSVFGFDDWKPRANDLHVLFLPLFTFYGLAFLLVMWSRLEIRIRLVQVAFIAALYAASCFPFLGMFLELHRPAANRIQWPPYVPPYIAIMRQWTEPREIIAADMPWAVAWYADRRSLWLPFTVKEYLNLNDYNTLKAPIVGLYLTPISADEKFISQIINGEYKEWWPFITRSANLKNFPLKAVTPLPIENRCVFYADRDRWTLRED